MKTTIDRLVLTVCRNEGAWAVEEEGRFFGHCADKNEAKAAANKRARQMQDEGRLCQVRISGEHGFYGN